MVQKIAFDDDDDNDDNDDATDVTPFFNDFRLNHLFSQ